MIKQIQGGPDEEFSPLRPVIWFLFGLLAWNILKYAWVGEDSYIAWRVSKNLMLGHGLRWNIAERVQVFTNPFWFFLVTGFAYLTHEFFITAITLGLLCSLGAVYISMRFLKPGVPVTFFCLAALLSSKAFNDYATSGLENSLGALLAVLFAVILIRQGFTFRSLAYLTFTASLAAFNRLDSILLFMPALLYAAYNVITVHKGGVLKTLAALFVCSAPLWLWLIFSTVYYGSPLPNTYFAKTNTGIPINWLRMQGILYFIDSLKRDTVTLTFIIICLFITFRKGSSYVKLPGAGIVLYLLYTINVGADFMSGRFFMVPFVLSVSLLFSVKITNASAFGLGAAMLILGFTVLNPVLLPAATGPTTPLLAVDHIGIADERKYYFKNAGLTSFYNLWNRQPTTCDSCRGETAVQLAASDIPVIGNIGYLGFEAKPEKHIVDYNALGDAFFSRLPMACISNWRIGHFGRPEPLEYVPSLRQNKNLFSDPRLYEIYDAVHSVTRDPYFAPGRWTYIYRLNTGYYNKLLKYYIPEFSPDLYHKTCGTDTVENGFKVRVSLPGDTGYLLLGHKYLPVTVKPNNYRLEIQYKTDDTLHAGPVFEAEAYEKDNFFKNRVYNADNITADGKYHTLTMNFEIQKPLLYLKFNIRTFGNGKLTIKRMAAYPQDMEQVLK